MKTISITQLRDRKFKIMPFTGAFRDSFGTPERNFQAIIYGDSGDGKTDFCIKLAKHISQFTRVLYVSHEDGISSTIQVAFERNDMAETVGRITLAEKGTFDDLVAYLQKKRSPGALIIDSLDYMQLTAAQYKRLVALFPRKAIIIVSWASKTKPKTQPARDIEYMCDIKIFVRKYVAYPRSRYGGNKPFAIWPEKANQAESQGKLELQ